MTFGAPRIVDPLRLTPVLVPKPWGGRRLADWNQPLPPDQLIGEAWLVADLAPESVTTAPDPVTRVADGPLQGRTLRELIAMDQEAFLGRAEPMEGRFPLLVKLLDARQHLSVQLHPHEIYAAKEPDVTAKTETWVVLQADPGAELMLGLADGVTNDDLVAALGTPDVVPLLRSVPAVVGDVHHVRAGMVHALGAGVVVAEVQTPGDTTFRLYDWAAEYDRAGRATHAPEVMRCLRLDPENLGRDGELPLSRTSTSIPYEVLRISLNEGEEVPVDPGLARVLLVVEGAVAVGDSQNVVVPGGMRLLPAVWDGAVRAVRPSVALVITPSTPSAG